MLYMNEYEIEEAALRWAHHPILGRAARFLAAYRDEVNACSDGWPYWAPPVRAAKKLMELIQAADPRRCDPSPITEARLTAALSPIRAFYTRRGKAAGMRFPAL